MIVPSSSLVLPTSPVQNSRSPEFPVATTQYPVNQSVSVGQTATFSVSVASNGVVTYQWQTTNHRIALLSGFVPLPGAEGDGFWAIVGATQSSFTTPALVAADNGTQFQCLIKSSNTIPQSVGNIPSSPFTIPQNLFTTLMTPPVVLLVH